MTTARKTERVAIINEVRVSLEELKRMVDADGARLTVLVLPILRPPGRRRWGAAHGLGVANLATAKWLEGRIP